MYRFVDTTERQSGSTSLPSEAMNINGQYIENLIPGYRTLYTSGRETLSPEIETYETGVKDGAAVKSKRYPARTIVVGYQLVSSGNTAFREAFNRLNAILSTERATVIFNDEPDKFFVGTPSSLGSVEPGKNTVVGEFEILCADPFKYSVQEYEVAPELDDGYTFAVDYNGTYKSYPTLEAAFYSENESGDTGEAEHALTGNGDCGYVAFFNEEGKIIQLGDPDEEDTESYPRSQTLVSQSFTGVTAWTAALNALWLKNQGVVSSSVVEQKGSAGFAHSYNTTAANTYYLKAVNYGSGNKYHGPTIARVIPADASGHVGAKDWTFKWAQKTSIGNGKNDNTQCGCFQVFLSDSEGGIVAGISIFKSGSGNNATLRFYVNRKNVKDMNIDISYHNLRFGNDNDSKGIKTIKSSSIVKSGNTISFNIGGTKETFKDVGVVDREVVKITFVFGQYGTKPSLSYNGLYSTSFIKNNCDTWRDIPNKFSSHDVVIANCKEGEILLNDALSPELGALGNDWEDFYLRPGTNQIGASYSDWVQAEYAPKFKMRYREVFL